MDLDIKDLSIFLATPVNRDFPWQTARSLIETAEALTIRGVPHSFQFLAQGSQIDHDRSQLAHQFLQSKHNRIFWIDSDMSWDADSFLRVLALSTVHAVVGASYPAKKGPGLEFHIEVEKAELEADEYGCLKVWGLGLGFCCVAREVIEKLAEQSPRFTRDGEVIPMIFRTGIDDEGTYRSEDMHFFRACRKLGYAVNVDPTVELGHIGGKEYRGRLIDALKKAPVANGVKHST
ncbi:MAG: hypothetical protein V4510_11455, partial [bacterium]